MPAEGRDGRDRAFRPPAAVLFDWDNTLADNWATIFDALNTTLVAMDHAPWSYDEVRDRLRHSLRDSFPRLFGERWRDAEAIFYRRFEEAHVEHLTPLDGAAAVLERLAAAGVPLGVVSNKRGYLLRREADALGWTKHFRRIVGAGDATRDKPDRAPIELALASTGVPPGPTVWYVGDAAIDMACAHAADCLGVLVGTGTAADDFAAHPADFWFATLADLELSLQSIMGGLATGPSTP
jgi:phosphoglycolate phosphatase